MLKTYSWAWKEYTEHFFYYFLINAVSSGFKQLYLLAIFLIGLLPILGKIIAFLLGAFYPFLYAILSLLVYRSNFEKIQDPDARFIKASLFRRPIEGYSPLVLKAFATSIIGIVASLFAGLLAFLIPLALSPVAFGDFFNADLSTSLLSSLAIFLILAFLIWTYCYYLRLLIAYLPHQDFWHLAKICLHLCIREAFPLIFYMICNQLVNLAGFLFFGIGLFFTLPFTNIVNAKLLARKLEKHDYRLELILEKY